MSEHGRIIAVTERPLGSTLVADTAAGATTLTVVDAAEFDDQNGGWLSINDQVAQYDKVDDDTGIITLTSGSALSAAADEGDAVLLYDQLYQTIAVDKRADVVVDGADDNTDAIDAGIALHLVDKIDTGIRGDTGESVILEEDAGDWKIIDVLGRGDSNSTGVQFFEDASVATSAGAQAIVLTHSPADHSEHVYWNGLYQPASEWSREGRTITVLDDAQLIESGDTLTVEYAYRVTASDSMTVLDYQASGWRYLQIALTDTTDRSAPGFDDSGWTVASAAFTTDTSSPHPWRYPAGATNWPNDTAIWLRRNVTLHQEGYVTANVRIDNSVDLYWDGKKIGSYTTTITNHDEASFSFRATAGSHSLALRAADDTDTTDAHTYADVQILLEVN